MANVYTAWDEPALGGTTDGSSGSCKMDLFNTADDAAKDFSLEAAISSLSSDSVLIKLRIMLVHIPTCSEQKADFI